MKKNIFRLYHSFDNGNDYFSSKKTLFKLSGKDKYTHYKSTETVYGIEHDLLTGYVKTMFNLSTYISKNNDDEKKKFNRVIGRYSPRKHYAYYASKYNQDLTDSEFGIIELSEPRHNKFLQTAKEFSVQKGKTLTIFYLQKKVIIYVLINLIIAIQCHNMKCLFIKKVMVILKKQ